MGDVAKGEGRTVLFVSHNVAAVKELCKNSILLANGNVRQTGNTKETVNLYLQESVKHINVLTTSLDDKKFRRGNGEVRFSKVEIHNSSECLDPSERIRIKFEVKRIQAIDELFFSVIIMSIDGSNLLASKNWCVSSVFVVGEEWRTFR
jgi:ABC-type multidrug transport system ATPase subunit